MTQEEKELLLKDLCARLKYGVKIKIGEYPDYVLYGIIPNADKPIIVSLVEKGIEHHIDVYVETIKPYLRPLSDMTEEERNEWADLFNLELDKLNSIDDEDKAEELAPYYFGKSHQVSIDWLNSHHFDYRGLIEKGLALLAPKDMYNFK